MGLAVVLILLLVVAWFVLPISTLLSVKGLETEIGDLKRLIRGNEGCGVTSEPSYAPERALPAGEAPVPEAPVPEATVPVAEEVVPVPEEVVSEREESAPVAEEAVPVPVPEAASEPTAMDVLLERVEDWFYVRGAFAPKGATREFAVATRWLVRAGLALLTASVVYFVKLSVDRGWLGPEARVAATVFWGAVSVAGGVALVRKTRYGLVGHALAALGVVALYLGFGLGHRYFTPPVIESPTLAFAALALVTVVAGVVAVILPSPAIAAMGLVGGYLVPVLAERGASGVASLCLYLLALNAGAFCVARRRGWPALDFLASACAYATAFILTGRSGQLAGGVAYVLFAFMTAVHALCLAGVVQEVRKRNGAGRALVWTGLALNGAVYLGWLGTGFRGAVSDPVTGAIFLVLVAAYLAFARIALRRGWMDRRSVEILLVFALAYLALAPLLLFSLSWCTVSWAAVAAAAGEAEVRTEQRILGVFSGVLLVAASVVGLFLLAPAGYLEHRPFEAGAFLLRLVRLWSLPAAIAFVARRRRNGALLGVAAVFGFLFLTGEAHVFGATCLPELKGGTVTAAWTLCAFGALWTGILSRIRQVRYAGLGLICVSVAKLLLFDLAGLPVPARVGACALVGVLMMVGAALYMKFRERFEEVAHA